MEKGDPVSAGSGLTEQSESESDKRSRDRRVTVHSKVYIREDCAQRVLEIPEPSLVNNKMVPCAELACLCM